MIGSNGEVVAMSKYFDIFAYLMGKKAGSGGGGDITVESKSISANGTYTAPTGKAYSPVSVDVPNSYAAGDEGKVVSNGALVAQGSDTVTQNGTVDTTLINSLVVNVQGGGGYGYTKLAEQDFEVNTSSTSATDVGTLSVPDIHLVNGSKLKIIFVKIRDKAGKRNGYYYGNDCLFVGGSTVGYLYKYADDALTASMAGTSNGVYALAIYANDTIGIRAKYNATSTLTINGTYHVEVYALDWPDGVSPFATS